MMAKRGKIIIIVAPSGTGKSTLIKRVINDFPQLNWSVSFTTRPRRKGEREGEHYFFISPEEFLKKRDRGDFVEWAEVHGNFYGTSREFVLSQIDCGHSLLFDLDVQGAEQMKNIFGGDAQVVYIAPPSVEELEKRLRGRKTDSGTSINLRLENARHELSKKDDFDYLVINDDLEDAFVHLKSSLKDILKR